MGVQKPGFSEDIRWDTQIREKTRFLGVTHGLRNRVFPKIFVATRGFGKKPGFLVYAGAQKPGFSENIRCDTRIREKTRFLGLRMGSETGFFRRYSLRHADSRKNPVSWCDARVQKPGFSEDIRCDTRIREKTRFLGVTRGGSETGFLRKYSFRHADSRKNPVSLVGARNS